MSKAIGSHLPMSRGTSVFVPAARISMHRDVRGTIDDHQNKTTSAMPSDSNPDRNTEVQPDGLSIISDEAAFLALKSEWDALWSAVEGQHNQAFEVCRLCWTRVAGPRGRRLHCIVVREQGELVLVWPLVSQRRLLWNVIEPLTPGTAEHSAILARSDARAAIDAAWQAATRQCRGDVFALPYVGRDTRLDQLATRHPGLAETTTDVCATALLRAEPDWDAYRDSLGKLSKKKPAALERRLMKEGALEIRELAGDDTAAHAQWVDWMLARKREWAERSGKNGPWLYSKEYRSFLVDLLDGTRATPLGVMFVMTLDGVPLVVNIVGLADTSASGLIAGFDPAFSRFSPGAIMMAHCVKWCWDHRLDLDFGVGKEEFKAYWSRGNVDSTRSYQIAISGWGRFAFHAKLLSKKLKEWRANRARRHVATVPASGNGAEHPAA